MHIEANTRGALFDVGSSRVNDLRKKGVRGIYRDGTVPGMAPELVRVPDQDIPEKLLLSLAALADLDYEMSYPRGRPPGGGLAHQHRYAIRLLPLGDLDYSRRKALRLRCTHSQSTNGWLFLLTELFVYLHEESFSCLTQTLLFLGRLDWFLGLAIVD